jgi:predicted outer membrane repeat protein
MGGGAGSADDVTLRYAIVNAQNQDIIRFGEGLVKPGASAIELDSRIQITRSIAIEGGGVILTRSDSWETAENNSQLLYLNTAHATVKISRVHFKGGRAASNGAAIRKNNGSLTLESCIFSGNQTSSASAYGGAVYNNGILDVRGCTFGGNESAYRGGAIYTTGPASVVTLTGNLFYGNTAEDSGPVVYRSTGTVVSGGYNAADAAIGTKAAESGWAAGTGDTVLSGTGGLSIAGAPFDSQTFAPVNGLRIVLPGAALPNFPETAFYGEARTWPGAPGAVNAPPLGR